MRKESPTLKSHSASQHNPKIFIKMQHPILKTTITAVIGAAAAINYFGFFSFIFGAGIACVCACTAFAALVLLNGIIGAINRNAHPITPETVLKGIVYMLVWGSGLESGKKHLWWHPAIWVWCIVIIYDIALCAIIVAVSTAYDEVLAPKHYRSI